MTGYIAKHWRGQLPLAQSLWSSALAILPFALWFVLAGNSVASHPAARPAGLIIQLALPFLLFVLVDVWGAVGVWRCASRRNKFGRPSAAWAQRCAQAAVIANFALLMAATVMFAGQVAAIFVRPHSGALAYEVALRGNTAVFHGRMNAAAASELELLLNDKTVKRLAITDSSGGQAAPALTLAKIIHTRRLFVVALGACDPACVFLLSAGSVRAVVPQTVFEFGSGIDRNLYLRAGLAGTPFDALHASSAGAAYKPSLRTLIGNGFVTSIFVVANRRYMRATTWCAKNPVACMRPAGQNAGPPETRGGG